MKLRKVVLVALLCIILFTVGNINGAITTNIISQASWVETIKRIFLTNDYKLSNRINVGNETDGPFYSDNRANFSFTLKDVPINDNITAATMFLKVKSKLNGNAVAYPIIFDSIDYGSIDGSVGSYDEKYNLSHVSMKTLEMGFYFITNSTHAGSDEEWIKVPILSQVKYSMTNLKAFDDGFGNSRIFQVRLLDNNGSGDTNIASIDYYNPGTDVESTNFPYLKIYHEPIPSVPGTPTNLNVVSVSSYDVVLNWDDVSDETGYILHWSLTNNTNTGVSIVIPVSNITSYTDISVSPLTTNYYWIKATNTFGNSKYSAVAIAITPSTNIITPVLHYPGEGSYVSDMNPMYCWSDDIEADLYTLVVKTNNLSGATVWSQTTSLTNIAPGLSGGGVYVWRVRARKQATSEWQPWTETNKFVIDTVGPTSPVLISPLDGTVMSATIPDFIWNSAFDAGSSIDYYELRVGAWTTNLSETNLSGRVFAEGVYEWSVRAYDMAGNASDISVTNSVTLDTNEPAIISLNPPDLFATSSQVVSFSWSGFDATSGIDAYIFEWSSSSSFTLSTIITTNAASTNMDITIANGTNWWRMRAYDAAGNTNSWTTARRVIVDTNIIIPVLHYPEEGSYISIANPSYLWSRESAADRYRIVVKTNNLSGVTMASQQLIGVDATNTTLVALSDGVYVWRVQARKQATGEWQPWTETNKFVIDLENPSIPGRISPGNGEFIATNTLSFIWNRAMDNNSISYYEVDFDGGSIITNVGNFTNWTITGLVDGIFTWTVESYDIAGNGSGTGAIYTFRVDLTPPSAPSLTSPADNTVTNTGTINFTWGASFDVGSGMTNYTILMSSNNFSGTQRSYTTSGPGQLNWTPGALSDGNWSWKVYGVDKASNRSSDSEEWLVTIDTTPPVVNLISPTNLSVTSSQTVSFSWSGFDVTSGINEYIFEWSSNNFTTSSIIVTNAASTNMDITVAAGTNWWRMRAYDAADNTNSWTTAWRVIVSTQPIMPVLYYPGEGSYIANMNPIYYWSDEAGADQYRLLVKTNTLSGATIWSQETGLTNLAPGVLSDGVYVWRVQARKQATSEWQAWTGTNRFVIDTTAPAPPALVSPTNNEDIATGTPELVWNSAIDINGIDHYDVRIDVGLPVNVGNVTNWTVSPALAAGPHTWEVRAFDVAGNVSTWSIRTMNINTNTNVTTPSLVEVRPESYTTMYIEWTISGNATGYTLYRNTILDTNTAVFAADLKGAANIYYYDRDLESGIMYYYWVKAYNDFIVTPLSSAASNSTEVKVAPSKMDKIIVGPNPYNPNDHHNRTSRDVGIMIDQVPIETVIRIYTISGALIRELKADSNGVAKWDIKNENGTPVANGVYVIHIRNTKGEDRYIKSVIAR